MGSNNNLIERHFELNPQYTFDTYVVKTCNKQAYVSAKEVVESFVQANNPLFLYGEEGTGKTHLLHAIGNAILEKEPDKKVLYVTGEWFSKELAEVLKSANVDFGKESLITYFRNKYRNVDALLIDDIQFITGKESTQEEFFHTFNHLHACEKMIVITSDKPPREIERLETRLQTRFAWGKVVEILHRDRATVNREASCFVRKKE